MPAIDPAAETTADAFARLAVELHDAEGVEETVVQFALQALNCNYADDSAAGQVMIGPGWSKQGPQSPRDARDPWCGSWCGLTETYEDSGVWCGRTCEQKRW